MTLKGIQLGDLVSIMLDLEVNLSDFSHFYVHQKSGLDFKKLQF